MGFYSVVPTMPCSICRRDRLCERPIAATHIISGKMFAVCWHVARRLTDIGGWSFDER